MDLMVKSKLVVGEKILGVDIGGSGIKGAIINVDSGIMLTERHRLETPKPATPKAVARVFSELVDHFKWKGLIGCGFPAIIKNGVAHSAANVDKKWLGENVEELLGKASGCKVVVRNDADVAGIAEMAIGAGKEKKGTVMFLTIGTGIGSALFLDGQLVPNCEMGHLKFKGNIAEKYVADSIRKKEDLSWDNWGERFNEYLQHLDFLFSPDLYILGGGASKKFDKFIDKLDVGCPVIPATYRNKAGIIGAASLAAMSSKKVKSS